MTITDPRTTPNDAAPTGAGPDERVFFNPFDHIFETDGVRLWHQGDDIAILSFKSKMNTIGAAVLEGVNRAVDEAERNYKALVIWQTREPFSAGADLKDALPVVAAGKWDEFEQIVASFQAASQRIKYSLVPSRYSRRVTPISANL